MAPCIDSPGWLSPRRTTIAVLGLLAAYAILAFTASLQKGLSFDEGEELAVGYNIWLRHDFRMEAANGDFIKRWASLPLLISKPRFPKLDDPVWREGRPYRLAYEFFFQSGNQPSKLLRQGRAMVVLLGGAMGLLIFVCSREIFGDLGGLVSLGLFAFSPNMLAFGGIVSTEMSTCLTLLASTWCIWRLLHKITWRRLLGSLAAFSLLLGSKPSALVIFPITALLLGARLFAGQPLVWGLGTPRTIKSMRRQAAIFSGLIALHAIFGWASIWAFYDFRYAASPDPADASITFRKQVVTDPIEPSVSAFIAWCQRARFLPEGYVRGIKWLLGEDDGRQAFMDGQWKIGGWRTFFPYTIAAKTSPSIPLFLGLGLLGYWRFCKKNEPRAKPKDTACHYHLLPYVVLIAVYLGVAIAQNVNIGHRHILPVYPAVYVLAGSVASLWTIQKAWIKVGVAVLFLWRLADSCAVYPDYLAYFSPWVGGPEQGYKHLVDSSLDWGMDLPGLKRWLNQHNPGDHEPLFLAYFGTGNPEYYKIQNRPLLLVPDWRPHQIFPLTPGIYAISATLFQSVGTATFGPWNRTYEEAYQDCLKTLAILDQTAGDPQRRAALIAQYPKEFWDRQYIAFERLRFGRLCAWLRHQGEPDDTVGYSILIWRLDAAALRGALLDPPSELADAPVPGSELFRLQKIPGDGQAR